ncbi:hypothetical protein H3V53_37055 [Paraburkholderia bengalensis]|uniref:Uncharacterized protein n=1 Tax=Paraburkholderia bengalensis TaxID=2747562 RepID=A0ABU8J4D3_9BURK
MQSVQQLDIFADSRDVVLPNGVLNQLQRREGAAARAALEQLAPGYPGDGALSAMTVLIGEPEHAPTASFADHAALAAARCTLEEDLVPAARRTNSSVCVRNSASCMQGCSRRTWQREKCSTGEAQGRRAMTPDSSRLK